MDDEFERITRLMLLVLSSLLIYYVLRFHCFCFLNLLVFFFYISLALVFSLMYSSLQTLCINLVVRSNSSSTFGVAYAKKISMYVRENA